MAIVIGGFVNGLGLVRMLAALGQRVMVITTQPYDLAHRSKHVSEHHHLAHLDNQPDALVALLKQHARQWSGAVVFPTNDEAMAALALEYDQLAAYYHLFLPPPECMPYILNKQRMLQAARRVGISVPHCYGPATESMAAKTAIRFPVVVKPVQSGQLANVLGQKVGAAHNPAELLTWTRRLAQAGVSAEVFDRIPGADSHIVCHCVYMDRQGEPQAECTIRKLRQSPPGLGIARVAEIIAPLPHLREQSIALLRQIGFRGIAATEFKYDPRDESFRFMEINGRSVVYNRLLEKGNMNLVKLAWSDYGDGPSHRIERQPWPGVWIHLHADVLRSVQNWNREQLRLRDYLGPYRRDKVFAVWSASDPKPFLGQWRRTAGEAVKQSWARIRPKNQTKKAGAQ